MRSLHPLLMPALFGLGASVEPLRIQDQASIGLYGPPRRKIGRSKYMPHQGERECARRRRQMAAAHGGKEG